MLRPLTVKGLLFQSTRPVRGATTVKAVGGNVNLFQSTRPVRGATENLYDYIQSYAISIHAPRAGRDEKFENRTRRT